MLPPEINQKLVIPPEDAATSIKESEAAFIYQFIRDKNLSRTLELGFAYGRSAAHIMAASEGSHIAIDPFQQDYQDLGLENMDKLGFSEKLRFERDYSHHVLPKLLSENKRFDFAFIDGGHKFDEIFLDFYYTDQMLDVNGFVLFHDTWMRSTQLVGAWIRKNRTDYKSYPSPLRNLLVFQKVGRDQRSWYHFREFYTIRSILLHPVISWLNAGEKTFLKKLVLALKRIFRA